jgi:hypothetical protein
MFFLSFTSYSIASLLHFPNLDIKSLRDLQIEQKKIGFHFHTSTFKWCLFLNKLIVDCKILPMFNSLLVCNNANKILNQVLRKWMPKHPNVSKYTINTNLNDNPSIQLFNRFTFQNSSKIQAINVAHLVYHFI